MAGEPSWFNHGDPRGAGLYAGGSSGSSGGLSGGSTGGAGGSSHFSAPRLPPGVTPNSTPAAAAASAQAQAGSSLSPADAASITAAVLDKIARQSTHQGIEFATVISSSVVEGQTPHAQIHVDGDIESNVITVPVLANGLALYTGLRVAIQWVNPHGCYVVDSAESNTTPAGRISFACGGGGSGG